MGLSVRISGVFNCCTNIHNYSKYLVCWETSIIENVRLVTPFSTYQSKFIYIFFQNLSFIVSHFPSAIIILSFTFCNLSLWKRFKQIIFIHEYCRSVHHFPNTILNNSACPRINLVDPLSNQSILDFEDQRLFTNFHGKHIYDTKNTSYFVFLLFCRIHMNLRYRWCCSHIFFGSVTTNKALIAYNTLLVSSFPLTVLLK